MKKLLFILLLFVCFSGYGQNKFPSTDSLTNYINRYVQNSAVNSFTNSRMNNILIGLTQMVDSLREGGYVDSIWIGTGDTLKYRIGSSTFIIGKVSGSSYTFTNGLTESGGVVRLGGTLTQNTLIRGGGYSLNIDTLSGFNASTFSGTTEVARLEMNNFGFGRMQFNNGGFLNLSSVNVSGSAFLERRAGTAKTTVVEANIDDASFAVTNTTATNRFITRVDSSNTFKPINYSFNDTALFLNNSLITKGYLNSRLGSITGGVSPSDTAAMLAPYLRSNVAAATYQPIGNYRRDIDTIPLATFTVGAGISTDTAAFQTTGIYGSFYVDGTDTLFITSYRVAMQGSSPSVIPEIFFNDSLNVTAGATKLVNSPSAITNTVLGTSVSVNNNNIPQGNWVFLKFTTLTTKPTYFTLTLFGYRKRRA